LIVKSRANREQGKLERRNEILDAAERLFGSRPEGLPSMDELAEAAGVAKGTLYLYFPSKEEVLVALHERTMSGFFDRLQALLETKRPFTVDDLIALGREEIIDQPVRLSLASLVIGLTERSLPPESALAFKMRMGERLVAAGTAMDELFGFEPGESTRLLNASYALTIGMWQLKGCMGAERYNHLLDPKVARAFINEYPAETGAAMRTLWAGATRKAK
jgi:AcrR family transcriptional regulator